MESIRRMAVWSPEAASINEKEPVFQISLESLKTVDLKSRWNQYMRRADAPCCPPLLNDNNMVLQGDIELGHCPHRGRESVRVLGQCKCLTCGKLQPFTIYEIHSVEQFEKEWEGPK